MATIIPPAPVGAPFTEYVWVDWYQKIRRALNDVSNLNHNDTLNIQGGNSTERYHLTAAQHADVLELIEDEWVYVKLASDFSTTSSTHQNVTAFNFTPEANSTYVIEGFFMLRSGDATVAPEVGISFPTGLNDGAYILESVTSGTAMSMKLGNVSTSGTTSPTDIPDTTNSYPGRLQATIVTGASPSGNVQITLARE